MSRRTVAKAGAALAALVVVVPMIWLVGHRSPGARLEWGTTNWNGSGNAQPGPVRTAWLFGAMDPCVDRGSVTVTGIAFTKSSNLVMLGWGHKPNPFTHGGRMTGGTPDGQLRALGFAVSPVAVTNLCSETNAEIEAGGNGGVEFAIQFRRITLETGWADGLSVTYRSGGHTRVSRWPLGFNLCGATDPPGAHFAHVCTTAP